MEEIKELETLETTEGTYNSFPDQAARKELKAKLSAPEGLKPGMLLKVKSLQAGGAVVLEGVVPTEAGEHPDNPVVDGITIGGENGVRFESEGEPSAPVLALYGAQGDEPVRLCHVAPAQEDGEAVPLGQVKELIRNQDSGQNPSQGGGMSAAAASLLIAILRDCATYSPQTANIDALEALLTAGAAPDAPPPEGVTQTGSLLTITSGVTVTQDNSALNIA